ncbi:MAG: methyltransferase domain-containing protein [bacterium]
MQHSYKWFYDNIHSHYYDLLIKWCFLPFGGEGKCREELLTSVDFSPKDKILDMCCGTGGATFTIAKRSGRECEIIGMDFSTGQIKVAKKKKHFSNITFVEGDVTSTGFKVFQIAEGEK